MDNTEILEGILTEEAIAELTNIFDGVGSKDRNILLGVSIDEDENVQRLLAPVTVEGESDDAYCVYTHEDSGITLYVETKSLIHFENSKLVVKEMDVGEETKRIIIFVSK